MRVRRLQLTTFRNYQHLDLDLPSGRLLFLGDNAQGKSNLLEAVHLLASGRSSRAGSDAEMIGWDAGSEATQPFARLGTTVEREDGALQLELIVAGQTTQQPGAGAAGGQALPRQRHPAAGGRLRRPAAGGAVHGGRPRDHLGVALGAPCLPRRGAFAARPRLLPGPAALHADHAAAQRDLAAHPRGRRRARTS